jgi:hypothetical protein
MQENEGSLYRVMLLTRWIDTLIAGATLPRSGSSPSWWPAQNEVPCPIAVQLCEHR